MDIRNCPQCGRIFQYGGRNLCPACVQQEDALFEKVRAYLHEHEGASVDEISEATEVEPKKIMHLLREGRLQVRDGSLSGLYCESCGAPVPGGRLCSKCAKVLEKEVEQNLQEWEGPRGNSWGMHSQEGRRKEPLK